MGFGVQECKQEVTKVVYLVKNGCNLPSVSIHLEISQPSLQCLVLVCGRQCFFVTCFMYIVACKIAFPTEFECDIRQLVFLCFFFFFFFCFA